MPDGGERRPGPGPAQLSLRLREIEAALGAGAWVREDGAWRVMRESGESRVAAGVGPAGAPPALVVPDDAGERVEAVVAAGRALPDLVALARAVAWRASLERTPAGSDPRSHARLIFQADAAIEAALGRIGDAVAEPEDPR